MLNTSQNINSVLSLQPQTKSHASLTALPSVLQFMHVISKLRLVLSRTAGLVSDRWSYCII